MDGKVVLNVEAQTIRMLLDEAAGLEASGDYERAERTRREANEALAISDVQDPYVEAEQVVPLTAGEVVQRKRDEKEHAVRAAAAEAAAAERVALIRRLKSGDATADEVQAVLAQLLT